MINSEFSQFPELVHLNESHTGKPVFWIHAVFGGAKPYYTIAKDVKRPFWGIQARGWMSDREPLRGIQAMAAYYVHIIKSVQPEGPYDLGGYSLGGLLAYEVTRQLQELGESVSSIVMIDTPYTPGLGETSITGKNQLFQAINFILRTTSKSQQSHKVLIHRDEVDCNLDQNQFLEQLIDLALAKGLSQPKDQLKSTIKKITAVISAYEVHRYTPPPLHDPNTIQFYYFRNKNGVFLGKLGPYNILDGTEGLLDHTNYWGFWEKQFSSFETLDVDSTCHLLMLSVPEVYHHINEFCRLLYSPIGVSFDLIQSFKERLKDQHGTLDMKTIKFNN